MIKGYHGLARCWVKREKYRMEAAEQMGIPVCWRLLFSTIQVKLYVDSIDADIAKTEDTGSGCFLTSKAV